MSVSSCTRSSGLSVNFSPLASPARSPLQRLQAAVTNLAPLSRRYGVRFGFGSSRHFPIGCWFPWRSVMGTSQMATLLRDLASEFGPIVLGMAIEALGGPSICCRHISHSLLQDCLHNACVHAREEIAQLILAGFQQELFDVANSPGRVPSTCNWMAQVMRQACLDYRSGKRSSTPHIFIQTESGLVETLNWAKLEYRLSKIHAQGLIASLCPSEPLGSDGAKTVIELMKLGLGSSLARCLFRRYSGQLGVCLRERELLQFILLGMLYLSKVPTDPQGRFPRKAFAKLYRLREFLLCGQCRPCSWLDSYVPLSGMWEHPIRYNCRDGFEGICVEQQRVLVSTCERVRRVFCSLMR